MTHASDPDIRRCADGSIDYAFYDARARRLRAEAIARAPACLAPPARRLLGATGRIAAALRSGMMPLVTLRHIGAGRLRGPAARAG